MTPWGHCYTRGMSTLGEYPVNPDTDLGRFRVLAGDSNPVTVHESKDSADYRLWSDEEILVYLGLNPDNIYRAVSDAAWALAAASAAEAKVVKDYDLQVDLAKRARELRETAARLEARADAAENAGEHFVAFDMWDVTGANKPEAAPYACIWQ